MHDFSTLYTRTGVIDTNNRKPYGGGRHHPLHVVHVSEKQQREWDKRMDRARQSGSLAPRPDIEHASKPRRRIPRRLLSDFDLGRRARACGAKIEQNPFGEEWERGFIAHMDAEIARLNRA